MLLLLIASGVVGLAAVACAQALLPRGQLYGKTFTGTRGRGRKLALTFDDGPNPRCTPQLLELLRKHDVKATFFLLGRRVDEHPALAAQIAAEGHAIGNHTYSHPTLIFCSRERIKQELEQCERALADAGISNPDRLVRPPRGARLPSTISTIRDLGYTPVNWSITCWDWWPSTPKRIAWHATRQLRGGDVLLFHDGDPYRPNADRMPTLGAVDTLITRCKAEGFEFVTIGDWIRAVDASKKGR